LHPTTELRSRIAPAVPESPRPQRRVEIRCTGCGYGGVVAHLPDRCPMCGGTSWSTSESRARSRRRA